MIFASADDLAAAYFAGREQLESVRALDLRMIVADVCSLCSGGPSTEVTRRMVRGQRERHLVCASCGRPWEPEPWGERCVLRGEIQVTPRPGAVHDSLYRRTRRYSRLRLAVEPRPKGWLLREWRRALLLWQAWLHPAGGSARLVSDAATASGLTGCSPSQVDEVLRKARREVEVRARKPRCGLLR